MYASKMAPARPTRPNNNQLRARFESKNSLLTRLKSLWLRYGQVSNKFIVNKFIARHTIHAAWQLQSLPGVASKWTSAEPSLESDDTAGDALLRHSHPSSPIGRNKTSQDWSDFSWLGHLICPPEVCYWPADADFESTSPFEVLRLETQEGNLQAPA